MKAANNAITAAKNTIAARNTITASTNPTAAAKIQLRQPKNFDRSFLPTRRSVSMASWAQGP